MNELNSGLSSVNLTGEDTACLSSVPAGISGRSLAVDIRIAGRTLCDDNWQGEWAASNPDTRLYWVTDGEGIVEDSSRRIRLLPGFIYLIPSYLPLRYYCPTTMDVYWIHCAIYLFGESDAFARFPDIMAQPVSDAGWTAGLWKRFLDAFRRPDAAGLPEADALLRFMIVPFTQEVLRYNRTAGVSPNARLVEVLSYIDSRLHRQITLSDLAGVLNLHPTYLSNFFTLHLGEPPTVYINRRRIERAQGLLVHTTLPVKTVARQVGFSDPYYFTRVFKRLTGLSPLQFRRQSSLEEAAAYREAMRRV